MKKLKLSFLSIVLFLGSVAIQAGSHYVAVGGTGDGLSWSTASGSITLTLADCQTGDIVYVSAGVYNEAIVLKDGVQIMGGYHPQTGVRDIDVNITTLDGAGLSNRLLTQTAGFVTPTTVEGFTLINGAPGTLESGNGGGAYINANMTLSRCHITNCTTKYGAGVYNEGGKVSECLIEFNIGGSSGGGIYNIGGIVDRSIIRANKGRYAAGIRNEVNGAIQSVVSNSIIANNECTASWPNSGGIYNPASVVTNCVIVNNVGLEFSAIYSTGKVLNTICWNNKRADTYAGALDYISTDNGSLKNAVEDNTNTSFIVLNVENASASGPKFVAPSLLQGVPVTPEAIAAMKAADWRLQETSVCVDAGTANGAPLVDIEGSVRPKGNGFDIGAYEFNSGGPIIAVQSVSLNFTTVTIKEMQQRTLVANILPINAANKAVIWSSSDSNIATVNDGVILAKLPGMAVITAKTIDGEKTASCEVTVIESTVTVMTRDHIWNYNDKSTDLSPGWLLPSYDYSSWSTGASPLGFAFETSTIAQLNTVITKTTPNQPSVYFKTKVNIASDIDLTKVDIYVDHIVDDAMYLYVNGQKVYSYNGSATGEAFSVYDATASIVDPVWEINKLILRDGFVVGDNEISVMVKNSSATSSDLVFGMSMRIVPKTDIAPDADSLVAVANALNMADYTIPSWTLMLAAKKIAKTNYTVNNISALKMAIDELKNKAMPYSFNMNINGDPTSQLGFAWFTNAGIPSGKVQLVAKKDALIADFSSPSLEVNALSKAVNDINYITVANGVDATTEILANEKRSYLSNKALATGLLPNTTYSFRVGNEGSWSPIGSFTTAAASKDKFSFLYMTDTQALNASYFEVSKRAVTAAVNQVKDARFVLITGDLVETGTVNNAEWEWEQWFETSMKAATFKIPLTPTDGNHDDSSNLNYTYHFNTDNSFNATATVKPQFEGINYSFVYGDALFIVYSFQDYWRTGYLESLKPWFRQQIANHPNTKWRIAAFHKPLFTGSGHINDADSKLFRDEFLPLFDELKIDLAIQGHDHVYEVIGPINNKTKTVIPESVSLIQQTAVTVPGNVKGQQGGVYNVNGGTLYFNNGAAGLKVYNPYSKLQMEAGLSSHGVDNYWDLFTGKFGQSGMPSFSDINVSTDEINISTYTVNTNSETTLYDSFKIIKKTPTDVQQVATNENKIYPMPAKNVVFTSINGIQKVDVIDMTGKISSLSFQNQKIDISNLSDGFYFIQIITKYKTEIYKLIKKSN